MERIRTIEARVIPLGHQSTVEVRVTTERRFAGTAALPLGISVGANEARLIDPIAAVQSIQGVVAPALKGKDALEQRVIDEVLMELDPTTDRSTLGVNALFPVSMAVARAAANALERELYHHLAELAHTTPALPVPIQVMFEGGKHAAPANHLLQELSFIGSSQDGTKLITALEQSMREAGQSVEPGGEGGLIVALGTNSQALSLLQGATKILGLEATFAVDAAASHGTTQAEEIIELINQFPLALVEDPIDQANLSEWHEFTRDYGHDRLIAADDLTVGNPSLIKDAVKEGLANCLVVKLGQTATLSELFDLISLVQIGGWAHVVSHRGLETRDSFIADLAVATGARYLKAGTTRSLERKEKYDRLDEIAKQLLTK
jgi:enolase